jgi:hypothetical protein
MCHEHHEEMNDGKTTYVQPRVSQSFIDGHSLPKKKKKQENCGFLS